MSILGLVVFFRRSPDELHTLCDSLSTGIFHQQVDVIDLKFLVEVSDFKRFERCAALELLERFERARAKM